MFIRQQLWQYLCILLAVTALLPSSMRADFPTDWEWGDEWGEATCECSACGTVYQIFEATDDDDAENQLSEYFCENCGHCNQDGNSDCYEEHHCCACGVCLDDEYHEGYYDVTGKKICLSCWDDVKEYLDGTCNFCHEIFGAGVQECNCEYSNIVEHCTDCSGSQCQNCGVCLEVDGDETMFLDNGCADHNICGICIQEDAEHCKGCGECGNDICGECELCENCWSHCPECDNCPGENEIEMCESGGDHCKECCNVNGWLCAECGECVEGKGTEICSDCGLCEECCNVMTESASCSHGYCVESSDYEEHLCPECGNCPGDNECEYCHLCADCQPGYHCDHELCPEGDEWDEHLCSDCGECFEPDELCEYCGKCESCQEHCDHGYCPDGNDFNDDSEHFICDQCGECFDGGDRCGYCELCNDCCEDNTQAMGCDHQLCVENLEFVDHWCYEDEQCMELCDHDSDCEHKNVGAGWKSDGNAHWHVCQDCGMAVDRTIHSEGEFVTLTEPDAVSHRNGTAVVNCAVCENRMGVVTVPYVTAPADGSPYIITQPKDYVGKASTVAWTGVDQEEVNRYATYKVRAGGANLKYQWYRRRADNPFKAVSDNGYITGSQTAEIKVWVYTDECNDTWQYYCVVSNDKGSVQSDTATSKAQHTFGRYENNGDGTHSLCCLGECGEKKYDKPHNYGEWELVKAATSTQTGQRRQKCVRCTAVNTEVIPVVEPGHVHAFTLYRQTATQHSAYCSCGVSSTEPAQDHTFGTPEVTRAATEKHCGKQRLTCTVCSLVKEEMIAQLPHVHDWYSFSDSGMEYYDSKLKRYVLNSKMGSRSASQHLVHCKGCDQVKVGGHVWGNFWGAHEATATQSGLAIYECEVCGYQHGQTYEYGSWPIEIAGGKAYKLITKTGQLVEVNSAKPGAAIFVKYDTSYGEAEAASIGLTDTYYKFKKWVDFKTYIGQDMDVPWGTGYQTIPSLTVQSVADYPNVSGLTNGIITERMSEYSYFTMPDGPAVLYADLTECDHPESSLVKGAAMEPTCGGYGHKADIICKLCNKVMQAGERIEPLGHDLPDEPIEGTRIVACCTVVSGLPRELRPNTEVTHGYSGDFTCKRCNKLVRGKQTPLEHVAGFNAAHVNNSYYVPELITEKGLSFDQSYNLETAKSYSLVDAGNCVPPTCTKGGYTGDKICKYCNKIAVKGSRTEVSEEFDQKYGTDVVALGHCWGAWEVVREATPKVKGLERRVCLQPDGYEWIPEHEETRTIDYAPDYGVTAPKTKLVFEWEYGKEPAAQTITFNSVGRNVVKSLEAAEFNVGGAATVKFDGLSMTVKPKASAFRDIFGKSGKDTLTLTEVAIEGGTLAKGAFSTQPIELVMRVKKGTPSFYFEDSEKTVSVGEKTYSLFIEGGEDDMTYTYTSSDNSVAVVDALTGDIKTLKAGTATITAKFAGNAYYTSGQADFTLNVVEPTKVEDVKAAVTDTRSAAGTYDLSGRKVEEAQGNGVYITDGKKVAVSEQ